MLLLGEAHLRRVLREYVAYFNTSRSHQGLHPRIPDGTEGRLLSPESGGTVRAVPVLGGVHHAYRRVA